MPRRFDRIAIFQHQIGPRLPRVNDGPHQVAERLDVRWERRTSQGFQFLRFYVSQSGKDLEKITELVETGALSVVIDQVLPLEQAAKAHELIESQRVSGKIVLTVG